MHPELLIVDYRLSGDVSGIETAKKLQAQLAYPVPVLMITGDTGPERLREADASASASGYQFAAQTSATSQTAQHDAVK